MLNSDRLTRDQTPSAQDAGQGFDTVVNHHAPCSAVSIWNSEYWEGIVAWRDAYAGYEEGTGPGCPDSGKYMPMKYNGIEIPNDDIFGRGVNEMVQPGTPGQGSCFERFSRTSPKLITVDQ